MLPGAEEIGGPQIGAMEADAPKGQHAGGLFMEVEIKFPPKSVPSC